MDENETGFGDIEVVWDEYADIFVIRQTDDSDSPPVEIVLVPEDMRKLFIALNKLMPGRSDFGPFLFRMNDGVLMCSPLDVQFHVDAGSYPTLEIKAMVLDNDAYKDLR